MKLKIYLKNASLEAEQVQDHHVSSIISGFFNMLGLANEKPVTSVVEESSVSTTIQHVPEDKHSPLKTLSTENHLQNTRSRTLPKVNGKRTLFTPIKEVAKIKQLETNGNKVREESKHLGIKVFDDGSERYQCKYWCDCGHEGKRWIKTTTKHVYCHECNGLILVESATPNANENGLPEQDRCGNYYIARQREEMQ